SAPRRWRACSSTRAPTRTAGGRAGSPHSTRPRRTATRSSPGSCSGAVPTRTWRRPTAAGRSTSRRTTRCAPSSVAAEAVGADSLLRDPGLAEHRHDALRHPRRSRHEVAVRGQVLAQMVAQQLRPDPSRLAGPARILRHRRDQPEARVSTLEVLELVEERGRVALAVRVDEGDPVRQLLLVDVTEHAPEDRDPDSTGEEDVRP